MKAQTMLLRLVHPGQARQVPRTSTRGISKRWRSIAGRIARTYSAVNGWLQVYYRLCGRTGFDLPAAAPRTICLADGQVLRLTPDLRVSHIEVKEGTVWLTGCPANGDVLLREGDRFELSNQWPFVVQAIGNAIVVLVVA